MNARIYLQNSDSNEAKRKDDLFFNVFDIESVKASQQYLASEESLGYNMLRRFDSKYNSSFERKLNRLRSSDSD
jgi:hypothetical protein